MNLLLILKEIALPMAKLYGSLEAGEVQNLFVLLAMKFKSLKNSIPNGFTPYLNWPYPEFFKRYEDQLAGILIGSFGPKWCWSNSETYGFVTSTPKPHWSVDLLGLIAKSLMFLSTCVLWWDACS